MFLTYYIFSGMFCATLIHRKLEDIKPWFWLLAADFMCFLLGFLILPMELAIDYYERN